MTISISESKLPQHPRQNQKSPRRRRQGRRQAASVQSQQVVCAPCRCTCRRDGGSQGVGATPAEPSAAGSRAGREGGGAGPARAGGGAAAAAAARGERTRQRASVARPWPCSARPWP